MVARYRATPYRAAKKIGTDSTIQPTTLPSTTVLLKLVYGTRGVLYQEVHSDRSDAVSSSRVPMASKTGSSRNPTGTKSAHPSIAPPKETLSSTIREKTIRLCTFISGVSPSTDPSAIPSATCPGVPSECSVLMIDWISLSSVSMRERCYASGPRATPGGEPWPG